jgi:cell division protein FtsL
MKWLKPRIGTLMLLVIIVALTVALVIERRKAERYLTLAQGERNRADREAMYAEYRAKLLIEQARRPPITTPEAIRDFLDAHNSAPPRPE